METFFEEYGQFNGIAQYLLHYPVEGGFVVLFLHGGPGQTEGHLSYKTVLPSRVYSIVYYDQGAQYASQAYFELTQNYRITPSMSRRGNPYDNALAENFFSILKTECIHSVKIASFAEAKALIDDYIYFYNHERIQAKTKLTPLELRRQSVA